MKHKICIYAIARNEEQFVDRFCDAAAEADYIAVLDTGSTDRTVEKLSDRGVIVRQTTIEPWRFDVARNLSMLLIPRDTDLCVCVDLDEVLLPGWRAALEKRGPWTPRREPIAASARATRTEAKARSFCARRSTGRSAQRGGIPCMRSLFPPTAGPSSAA